MAIETIKKIDPEAEAERVRQIAKTQAKAQFGDSDMFQKLFLAQLKTQDPLEPMSNSDMLSQMSQNQSLELLNSINNTLSSTTKTSLGESSSLIGKLISGLDSNDAGKATGGLVTSIQVESGNTYANFGTGRLKINDILEVTTQDIYSALTKEA